MPGGCGPAGQQCTGTAAEEDTAGPCGHELRSLGKSGSSPCREHCAEPIGRPPGGDCFRRRSLGSGKNVLGVRKKPTSHPGPTSLTNADTSLAAGGTAQSQGGRAPGGGEDVYAGGGGVCRGYPQNLGCHQVDSWCPAEARVVLQVEAVVDPATAPKAGGGSRFHPVAQLTAQRQTGVISSAALTLDLVPWEHAGQLRGPHLPGEALGTRVSHSVPGAPLLYQPASRLEQKLCPILLTTGGWGAWWLSQ